MKVRRLIAELSNFDMDSEVVVASGDGSGLFVGVESVENNYHVERSGELWFPDGDFDSTTGRMNVFSKTARPPIGAIKAVVMWESTPMQRGATHTSRGKKLVAMPAPPPSPVVLEPSEPTDNRAVLTQAVPPPNPPNLYSPSHSSVRVPVAHVTPYAEPVNRRVEPRRSVRRPAVKTPKMNSRSIPIMFRLAFAACIAFIAWPHHVLILSNTLYSVAFGFVVAFVLFAPIKGR